MFIDPSIIKNNWFLINKHKYGNSIWIIKWLVLPCVVVFAAIWGLLFGLFAHAYEEHKKNYFTYIYILITTFGAIHVPWWIKWWRKYPAFNDNLGIRKEIKYILITTVIATLLMVISSILTIMVSPDLEMLMGIILTGVAAIFFYLTVIYPEKANTVAVNDKTDASVSGNGNATRQRMIHWKEIIKSMDGYEQFASFLEKEFSTENILFVTEYVQLKKEIMKIERYKNMIEDELKLDYDLILPLDIPKSIIAKEFEEKVNGVGTGADTDHESDHMVFNGLYEIYGKYIDSLTARMEVNVSSSTRYNLTNLFRDKGNRSDDIGLDKILMGMETAVKEISYLMNDSQSRFRKETIFGELIKKESIMITTDQ